MTLYSKHFKDTIGAAAKKRAWAQAAKFKERPLVYAHGEVSPNAAESGICKTSIFCKIENGSKAMSIKIIKYSPEYKNIWNTFIDNSKNGIMIFYRDYMEYHSDRFTDSSLLFFKDTQLVGIMPANVRQEVMYTHEGLTHGGIVSNYAMKTPTMLLLFEQLIIFLRSQNIKKLVYKATPHIYHDIPSEEDIYALYRNKSKILKTELSSVIYNTKKLSFSDRRKRNIKKACKNNLTVQESENFQEFMHIVKDILQEKYNVAPTHTSTELIYLRNKLPQNIKLFATFLEEEMLAGVLIYVSKITVHAQYIASTTKGKLLGALDLVFDHLINHYCIDKRVFDFGISTEDMGEHLNVGLCTQKEEFGARAIVFNTFELFIS